MLLPRNKKNVNTLFGAKMHLIKSYDLEAVLSCKKHALPLVCLVGTTTNIVNVNVKKQKRLSENSRKSKYEFMTHS